MWTIQWSPFPTTNMPNTTKSSEKEFGKWLYVWAKIISLVVYSYFEKGCQKNVDATTPKGNMGYDQYTVSKRCSCRAYFCCFPLALANIRPWPLMRFFQISLKKSELKTTHNTFRDCRVHFFRQPFSNGCERDVCKAGATVHHFVFMSSK